MTAAPAGPARRPRRERSVTETLCSIVLGLEAAVLFFVALAMFGLRVLDPVTALAGGAIGIVLFIAVAGQLRHRWGLGLGWALQFALIALGILLPVMYVVGAAFAAFWIYCVVRGGQIDRMKAERAAAGSGGDAPTP